MSLDMDEAMMTNHWDDARIKAEAEKILLNCAVCGFNKHVDARVQEHPFVPLEEPRDYCANNDCRSCPNPTNCTCTHHAPPDAEQRARAFAVWFESCEGFAPMWGDKRVTDLFLAWNAGYFAAALPPDT